MLFSLTTFALAATLVVLLPGPDTLVVVRNLLRGGRRMAGRAVLGVLSGLTVWVVTAALGLSAVLRASHDAYLGLRIAGAMYLIYIGVRSLRSKGEPARSGRRLVGSGYTSGLLTDLLNPKVGVFFVTFLRHLVDGLRAGHAMDGDRSYPPPHGTRHRRGADRLRPAPGVGSLTVPLRGGPPAPWPTRTTRS